MKWICLLVMLLALFVNIFHTRPHQISFNPSSRYVMIRYDADTRKDDDHLYGYNYDRPTSNFNYDADEVRRGEVVVGNVEIIKSISYYIGPEVVEQSDFTGGRDVVPINVTVPEGPAFGAGLGGGISSGCAATLCGTSI